MLHYYKSHLVFLLGNLVGSDGIKFGLERGNLVESRNIMSLIIKVRHSGNHIALESHVEK
jgi:hypothetical protein